MERQINQISSDLRKIQGDLTEIKVELATLRVKSSIWGAGAALLVLLPTIVVFILSK